MANNIMFVIFSICSDRKGYVAIACAGGGLEQDPLMVHALLFTRDHFDVLKADCDVDMTRLMKIGKHLLDLRHEQSQSACYVDNDVGLDAVEVYDDDDDEDENSLDLSSSSSCNSDDEEDHVNSQDISRIASIMKDEVRKISKISYTLLAYLYTYIMLGLC